MDIIGQIFKISYIKKAAGSESCQNKMFYRFLQTMDAFKCVQVVQTELIFLHIVYQLTSKSGAGGDGGGATASRDRDQRETTGCFLTQPYGHY